MKITKAKFDEIRERISKTTSDKWISYIEGRDHTSGSGFIMTGVGNARGPDIELSGATADDQDFIAHARQDIEVLIEIIERNKLVLEE